MFGAWIIQFNFGVINRFFSRERRLKSKTGWNDRLRNSRQCPPERLSSWASLFFRLSPSVEEVENSGVTGREDEERHDRFRRKKGDGEGVPESLYNSIKHRLVAGELPMTVTAIKRAARGADRAYSIIDRLQSERIIKQATNGRYELR
jgi:hypothetical protein